MSTDSNKGIQTHTKMHMILMYANNNASKQFRNYCASVVYGFIALPQTNRSMLYIEKGLDGYPIIDYVLFVFLHLFAMT